MDSAGIVEEAPTDAVAASAVPVAETVITIHQTEGDEGNTYTAAQALQIEEAQQLVAQVYPHASILYPVPCILYPHHACILVEALALY